MTDDREFSHKEIFKFIAVAYTFFSVATAIYGFQNLPQWINNYIQGPDYLMNLGIAFLGYFAIVISLWCGLMAVLFWQDD